MVKIASPASRYWGARKTSATIPEQQQAQADGCPVSPTRLKRSQGRLTGTAMCQDMGMRTSFTRF